MKNWYEIKNIASGVLNVSLHEEIGRFGVSASAFLSDINARQDVQEINVDIHSPGGSMLDGLAIYNGLKAHPAKINTHVTGIAASAAATVFLAGENRSAPQDGFIMIHNPYGEVGGEPDDMREVADMMDKFKQSSVRIIAEATGKSSDEASLLMKRGEQTWFSAKEALEYGLIHEISPAIGISNKSAKFSNYFKSMPFISNSARVSGIDSITDFERFLSDLGGISNGLATALTSRAKVIFQSDSEGPPNHAALSDLSARLSSLQIPTTLNR